MKSHYSDVWQAVARALPDRAAVVTRAGVVDYRRFAEEAGAFARHLADTGVRAGDGVAILSYNRPEYLVALFACLATGVAPVPINYRYRAREVADLLSDSGAVALLFPASLGETAVEAARLAGARTALIRFADDEARETVRQDDIADYADIVSRGGTLPARAPEGGELRLYTGGTTGRPKAVVWGDDDLFQSQLYSIYTASGLEVPRTDVAAAQVAADPATPRTATLPLSPLMHGTALFSAMNTLALGGTLILHASPRLDADEALRLAIDACATRLVVAGDAIAFPFVEAAERAGVSRLESLDSVLSSGMRFSDAAKAGLHALGDVTITDILASTEGGPFAVAVTRASSDLPGSLHLLPGAVVLDGDHREIQDVVGAVGILGFRGVLPKGYFRDDEKTRATFPEVDGVRHVVPGDWVRVLPDRRVEMLGRGSAVINTGGEKVYPVEVEEALLAHPAVGDVVVLGVPDSRFGELVAAVIAPAAGMAIDDDDLRAHLDLTLAGYKKPRHLIHRASIERSPHGKIDMAALAADVIHELRGSA